MFSSFSHSPTHSSPTSRRGGFCVRVSSVTVFLLALSPFSVLAEDTVIPESLLSATPLVHAKLSASEEPSHQNPALRLPPESTEAQDEAVPTLGEVDVKGWDHLYALLVREGIEPNFAAELLSDERMPKQTPIYFSLRPRESKYLYRKHNTRRARENALEFYRTHYRYFEEAHQRFGVPKSVMLAIIQVETACGSYTGRSRTFHGLARLSAASDPENVKANYELARVKDKNTTLAEVEARAKWLEQEFLPHSIATIELAGRMKIHPLELRGSAAGAIGIPQFLPGNVERFGFDGNGDDVIDLFSPVDAIPSVAKYLSSHGWKPDVPMMPQEQRKVIWAYNRSDSYIDTVLEMGRLLETGIKKSDEAIAAKFKKLL